MLIKNQSTTLRIDNFEYLVTHGNNKDDEEYVYSGLFLSEFPITRINSSLMLFVNSFVRPIKQ